MNATVFCPHCKLKYDKAARLRQRNGLWICPSCAEHYTAETLAKACENAARVLQAKANYIKIMARRVAA